MDVTAASWILGAHLHRLRQEAGYIAKGAGERLRCTASRIYSIEGGYRAIEADELRILVSDVYNRPDMLDQLESLRSGTQSMLKDRLVPYPDTSMAERLQLHSTEVRILVLDGVPGLCQTEGYTMAQHRAAGRGEEEARSYTASRMAHQDALLGLRDPPAIDVIITESGLHRAARVTGQSDRLVELAGRSNITLKVIPNDAGPHPVAASFTVCRLGDALSVLCSATVVGTILLDDPADVEHALQRWDSLATMARPLEESPCP